MTLGDALLVPEFLEVGKGLVDGLLLALLVSTVVGLVADFVWVWGGILLSREGSWGRLALLRSLRSFLGGEEGTFCWGSGVCF